MSSLARTPSCMVLAVLGATLLAGCESVPTEPTVPTNAPGATFNFMNGPAELPNVLRYTEQSFGLFIDDPETDLIVVQGVHCKGGGPFDPLAIQDVGQLRDVLHRLIVGEDVNLHVYTLSTFDFTFTPEELCGTPIAEGTGRVHVIDTDVMLSSGHASSFTIQMHGTLTEIATGQRLKLAAVFHAVFSGDGEVLLSKEHVQLNPVGGQ